MLSHKTKLITGFFLMVTLLAVIPMNMNAPIITELNDNQEIQGLGRSTYVVIPLTINVVAGGTAPTKAEIEANIKKMNEIYNCEVAIFVWDGTINTVPDPDGSPGDAGTPDGNLEDEYDSRKDVRDDAAENANNQGVSITIAGSLGAGTNGNCAVGNPHGAIVRSGTDGSTWAHEMQHALGQTHGPAQPADEDVNGDAPGLGTGWDVNGDGKITPADKEHNLWGRNSGDRTGSKINHDAIYGNATSIPGVRAKTRGGIVSAPNSGVRAATDRNTTLHSTNMTWFSAPWVDINRGGFELNLTNLYWFKFWLTVGADPISNLSFTLCFDNQSGGSSFGPWTGADVALEFTNSQGWWEVMWSVWNGVDWTHEYPEYTMEYNNVGETVSYDNETGSYVPGPYGVKHEARTSIPSILNLEELVSNLATEFWFVSAWWYDIGGDCVFDNTIPQPILPSLNTTPYATVTVDNYTAKPGNNITVSGTNFSPNATVSILINGVNTTTVKADATGKFSVNVTIPANTTRNNTIVSAVDTKGKRDAVYVDTTMAITNGGGPIPAFELIWGIFGVIAMAMFYLKKKQIVK